MSGGMDLPPRTREAEDLSEFKLIFGVFVFYLYVFLCCICMQCP